MADIALTTADRVKVVGIPERQLTLVAAADITAGAPVYITSAGKFDVADANGSGTTRPYGIATQTVKSGMACTAIKRGRMSGWTLSIAYDAAVYLSDTVGRIADAAGTTSVLLGRVVPSTAELLGTSPTKILEIDVP